MGEDGAEIKAVQRIWKALTAMGVRVKGRPEGLVWAVRGAATEL